MTEQSPSRAPMTEQSPSRATMTEQSPSRATMTEQSPSRATMLSRLQRLAWVRAARQRLLGLAPAEPPAAVPGGDLADAPLEVLASKIVFSHLRNRQQLLGPPPTALGHLDQVEAELLIRAAIAAAQANGRFSEDSERTLRGALSANGLQVAEQGFVAAALRSPVPLDTLLSQVASPHIASLFYAASLLAIDKHDPVNRAYLAFVAARLRLSADTLARLHSQYGIEDRAAG
ncbi:MAG: DUF533 domain-containing protein [Janthinobacterium lividum]